MKKVRRTYLKQKVDLYFDENFPAGIIADLRREKYWTRRCRIYSVYDFGNQGKDDLFQFRFCKEKGYTLVTLDADFMDDKRYPFGGIPGIVTIITKGDSLSKIKVLDAFVTFILRFPRPKSFLGDSKFQISEEGCVMRAGDCETREIKAYTIVEGKTLLSEVSEKFNYPIL
jgi:predicted nuclease of predicted toxin-antitoxin system